MLSCSVMRQFSLHGALCTLYILVILWMIAYCTLHYLEERQTHMRSNGHQSVFDEYNLHKIQFPNLNLDDDANYVTKKNSTYYNKESQNFHIQLPMQYKSFEDYMLLHELESTPYLPQVSSCSDIIQGKSEAIQSSQLGLLELKSTLSRQKTDLSKILEDNLHVLVQNCSRFLESRKYITLPLSAEEQAYPIAFIITIHKQEAMFERLLRSIYHPQNIYCVHVDRKSPTKFFEAIQAITQCFDNVFIATMRSDVHYTHYSRVQADLNCLHDLKARHQQVRWRYVINLCGQDFPLKTNLEIVRSLKTLNGFNNLETFTTPPHKKQRYLFSYVLPEGQENKEYGAMQRTEKSKAPSPLETPMFAGSAYFILKYNAVQCILTDPTVQRFLKWNEDTYSPDEHIWGTLQRWYPKLPGSFPPHIKYDLNELQSITRLVKWGGLDTDVYPKCAGTYMRGVCVYGVGDLSWLLQQHHLFANKFDISVDPFALECLDMWLRNRTIKQTLNYLHFGFV